MNANIRMIAVVFVALLAIQANANAQSAVVKKDITFYSEGVLCAGTLFLPNGYSDSNKVAAVILAPGSGQTGASLEVYATKLAASGILAMTFDYRGWGKSGGFLYFGEPVQWDDRLRFSQTTTKMRIVRQRLIPQSQVLDIRNAITYVQGEAGVDRARIGVWGSDLSGGHAVVVAGSDARVKAAVALMPVLDGKDVPRTAFAPNPEQQAAMIKLARTGAAPATVQAATSMNAIEAKLARADYHPYWYIDQVPQTTAVRFIVAGNDTDASIEANAIAAAKSLKVSDVVKLPDTTHALDSNSVDAAARATAEWFQKNL
jgi:dienelactone hydrolase